MNKRWRITAGIAGAALGTLGVLLATGADVPFVRSPISTTEVPWVIDVYEGSTLDELRPRDPSYKPVLTKDDITDAKAEFIADPFWIKKDGKDYIFFEILHEASQQGDLGVAESADGVSWRYLGIVLDETFHLSYPQVFEADGAIYMIPETGHAAELRLYKASEFPMKWTYVHKLMDGKFQDSTIFRHDNLWWLYALTDKKGRLELFYANALTGPWTPHPGNPIVDNDKNISRPGGRVIIDGAHIYRVTQDGYPEYGLSVSLFEVTKLTATEYEEKPAFDGPILGGRRNWFVEDRIHQLDARKMPDGRWLALVDRWEVHRSLRFPIGPSE